MQKHDPMHREIPQNLFKLLSDVHKQIIGKTLHLIFFLSMYDISICDHVCCLWMQAFACDCAYVKVRGQPLYRLSPSMLFEAVSCSPLFLPGLLAYQCAAILLSLSSISK